ncbi:LysR family transcriptional regulator [Aurantiacibacter flavus]|uniref:LysR family transcriptional regulator n=1 Tax=Aurantiacibacter flavus TaxID=3145232 RepID=A0ABV0CXI9_9SPHN
MRLRHIEVFHAVYENGSISGAARMLNVSQPSVSKVLRHAEDQLGYELFQRTKGRLVATPQAHELFSEVAEVYTSLSKLSRTAHNIGNRKGGHLRIAVLPAIGLAVAPRAIARLCEGNAEITSEITTLHSREMDRFLHERACDVAVGFRLNSNAGIAQTELGRPRLVLVTPHDAFGPPDQPVAIEDLHEVNFIGVRDSGPLADAFVNELNRYEVAPREVVTSHTYYAALALVREGMGITVADEYTVSALGTPDLSYYQLVPNVQAPIYAATLENSPNADLADRFIENLRAALTELSGPNTPEQAATP